MKNKFSIVLLLIWLLAFGYIYAVKYFNQHDEQYDFIFKTIVYDADCKNDYSDATIDTGDDFEKVWRKEIVVSQQELQDFSDKMHREIHQQYDFVEN